ncbi:predicted protein [Aspergillus terreus NIH2624]|uniref:Uncharacterized protein n=1 Tax=Aspergillus terreus (strain NIH 2624 / FGSC A1156) TaxID=341663 RepID=Q0CEP6_ASPTN|nr:uncharacterized protein ATEG_07838 [Aspergillus terreus NIH2624]EAU32100.1 predicted protein [Aspergillus terreus NIH2624]
MAHLTHLFAALYVLYSLTISSAWTFTWRNASDIPTVEEGSGGRPCKAIDHAKGKYFEFDSENDLVRIYLYGLPNCTDNPSERSETRLAKDSSGPLRGFAVIDLAGANTTSGELEPFPGPDWFKSSPNSPIVTAMGKRLVEENCGKYSSGPGPQWTDADRRSYQCWQEKLGYSGDDADGWPGKTSWDQLKVPATENTGPSPSTTTETPSSTGMSTGTPTTSPTGTSAPAVNDSSRSSLGGGEIAGIVVGSAVGVGLIGAIVYLARRIGWQSKSVSTEPPATSGQPGGGAGAGAGGGDYQLLGTAGAGDSKKTSMEKLPTEAETIPARSQRSHFAELPGDSMAAELSDSRRINEMSDGQRLIELGDGSHRMA